MTTPFPALSPDTLFSTFQTWTRQQLEKEVERSTAQTEAALDLLERAQEGGHELMFWQDALEHAEREEAIARRAFSTWQRDGKDAERRAFGFRRALCEATRKRLEMGQKKRQRSKISPGEVRDS